MPSLPLLRRQMEDLPPGLTAAFIESLPPALLAQIPSGNPPPGVTPNFVNPISIGQVVILSGSILFGITGVFVLNRLYAKWMIVKHATWDDFTCFITILFAAGYFVSVVWAIKIGIIGLHQWDVPASRILENTPLQMIWLTAILTCPAALFAKLTFFILYAQLFRPFHKLKIWIWAGGIFTTVFYIGATIALIVFMSPQPGQTWVDHYLSGDIYKAKAISAPISAVGFLIDVYTITVPIVGVSNLQLSLNRKISASLMFLTGSLACAASVVSLVFRIQDFNSTDDMWYATLVDIAAQTEVLIGVICACMPAMAITFRHHSSNLRTIKSRYGGYATERSETQQISLSQLSNRRGHEVLRSR